VAYSKFLYVGVNHNLPTGFEIFVLPNPIKREYRCNHSLS
jgi:hypothetical protein